MKRMFSLFFCIGYISLFAQDITGIGPFPDAMRVVKIDNTTQWTSTGFNVTIGDTVIVRVDGIAAPNGLTVPNTSFWLGPEGFGASIAGPNSPVPGAAVFSVVGRIGSSGTPFYIGRNIIFKSNINGELFLGINDEIFWDNYGYFMGYISKVRGNFLVNSGDEPISNSPQFDLQQNFPNPFNPSTIIHYSIENASAVSVTIYDINGNEVKSLLNGMQNSGEYELTWDGKDNAGKAVSSGTYFYQINSGNKTQAKKMLLLK